MKALAGIVPVIPTPFAEDESIDERSLRAVVDWVARTGLGGMCLPAYASEFYKLTEAERARVVAVAIETNDGRVPLVAQANHGSNRIARELARTYEGMGADLISFALPRQFATGESDLLRFAGAIADAVSVPVLIQDFNPGGASIGAEFIATLHRQHGNVRYVKLEEPLLVDKVVAIRERLGDAVGVLEGWGGYYMLEGILAGICGVMPGVAIADLLDAVFRARADGHGERAYRLFAAALPLIAFGLQNMELFLHVEKRLLVRRGLLSTAAVRSLTFTASPHLDAHIDYLSGQIMRILRREGFATNCGEGN